MSAVNQKGFQNIVQVARYSVLLIKSTSTNYIVNGFLLCIRGQTIETKPLYLLVSCWDGLDGVDLCELTDLKLEVCLTLRIRMFPKLVAQLNC